MEQQIQNFNTADNIPYDVNQFEATDIPVLKDTILNEDSDGVRLKPLFHFLFGRYKAKYVSTDDKIYLKDAACEFGIGEHILLSAIRYKVINVELEQHGKIKKKILSKKEIAAKLPLLRGGSILLRMLSRKNDKNKDADNDKDEPVATESISEPESEKPSANTPAIDTHAHISATDRITEIDEMRNKEIGADRISMSGAAKEFNLQIRIIRRAIERGVLSGVKYDNAQARTVFVSRKEIQEKFKVLRGNAQDPDRISMAAAIKEFNLNYYIIKGAIRTGVITAEVKKRSIIVSRKEIQEKLSTLRNLPAEVIYHKPVAVPVPAHVPEAVKSEPVIEPVKNEPVKYIEPLKVEGMQVWTTSPCINCKLICDPTVCGLLMEWAVKAR